jgi:Flp pilus assembly pilin Flp
MNQTLRALWNDDAGAIIATEYLFFATILTIGTIVGLTNLRDAINAELTELGNALLALNQSFTISGTSGGTSSTSGSQAIDFPSTLPPLVATPPAIPSVIDVALPGQ